MTRRLVLPILLVASMSLGGCVASIAATAARMAIQSAQKPPQSNAHLRVTARDACTARAASLGAVHIIDVEQRRVDRLVVWGTVTDARERRSFECHFTNAVVEFKLRSIRAAS